jgi:anti-sigma B factor antagonist
MEAKASRLQVARSKDMVHIEFLDRSILDESCIQQIGQEISDLIDEATNPRILLNFANVEHLSSAALGTLITINNRVKQRGGQLRLSNIDPQIYEVFAITRLNKLFQIHADVAAAAASFK